MGQQASTTGSVPAQSAWDNVVDRIYSSLNSQGGDGFGRQQLIDSATSLGAGEIQVTTLNNYSIIICICTYSQAVNAADAFMALVDDNKDGKVTKENLNSFLKARVVKIGHHGVPHSDDVKQLELVFDSSTHVPGMVKLLRQTSVETRQSRNTCHICRKQGNLQRMYSLHGSLPDDTDTRSEIVADENELSMPTLERQTSQDFIKSLSSSVCRHSFFPPCISKHVRGCMERGVAPFCPVCDEIIGLQDLSNILSEAELVKMLNAYPLTHSAVPSSLQSCTHCQGAVTIDAAVNDFEFVDNLVTLLLFKIDDMKPLSKAEVLACYEGKDNSDLLIYNRVARRFLTGAENSAGMTLSVEDRKQNYSWKLERCDAKISDKKVQIGGLRLRNANVKSALQNDGDGRTVTSSISEDSKASQFIMASEKDGEFAFAHVATRRYLQANEGGELGMYAPASAYVMNPTKVTLPTARTTVWTFFKAPQTAEQLIDSKFVARCTRCSGAAPVCAGCGKAPHHGAGSSPCEAAIYLRVQLTLETLDCISDLVSVRKFVEMKEEKDSKGDAKKR
jgi:hypothetical protein